MPDETKCSRKPATGNSPLLASPMPMPAMPDPTVATSTKGGGLSPKKLWHLEFITNEGQDEPCTDDGDNTKCSREPRPDDIPDEPSDPSPNDAIAAPYPSPPLPISHIDNPV